MTIGIKRRLFTCRGIAVWHAVIFVRHIIREGWILIIDRRIAYCHMAMLSVKGFLSGALPMRVIGSVVSLEERRSSDYWDW